MVGGEGNQERDVFTLEEMPPHLSHQPHADWPPVCQQEVSETLQIGSPHKLLVSSQNTTSKPWNGGHREPGGHKALEGQLGCYPLDCCTMGSHHTGGREGLDERETERGEREGSPLPLTLSAGNEPFWRSV